MASFEHLEHAHISLESSRHAQITLKTTSTITCDNTDYQSQQQEQNTFHHRNSNCWSHLSPFRSDVRTLMYDSPNVRLFRWAYSSESTRIGDASQDMESSSSGLSIYIEFVSPNGSNQTFLEQQSSKILWNFLDRVQGERILLSPLSSIKQQRYHRSIYPDGNGFRIFLPMDGFGFSPEAIQANLPTCGIWTLANADTWSAYLLGTHPDITLSSPRKIWMEMTNHCDNESCQLKMQQGIMYGKRLPSKKTKLSLNRFLPGNSLQGLSCPWTTNITLQVSMPSHVPIQFLTGAASPFHNTVIGQHRVTLHQLPENFATPFLEILQSNDDQSENSIRSPKFGRIDKIIQRPNGMASVGRLETTISNDDLYEAHISLVDIIPTYIRMTSMDISTYNATRTYQSLQDGTLLVQHDFILPPQSSTRLIIGYDPALLPFSQFPPDPNRGIELPPSWANWNTSTTNLRLYSDSLLLMPPVPDMSMPFNVISLTCTLYAFIIGSIINTIVRRAEERIYYKLYPDKKPKSFREKLRARLKTIVQKLTGRHNAKSHDEKEAPIINSQLNSTLPENSNTDNDNNWIPQAELEDDGSWTSSPTLLTSKQRQSLSRFVLPNTLIDRRWKRLYSLDRDGDTIDAFLHHVANETETILVVQTGNNHILGGYIDDTWGASTNNDNYYGSGRACLFQFQTNDNLEVYRWSGANRLIHSLNRSKCRIVMGGGGSSGDFGLCLDENFTKGSTARCETFDNEPLGPDAFFDIMGMEVYGFIRGSL